MGICQKCLTGRSGDVVGGACKTPGCDGIIEEPPTYASLVEVLPEPLTCRSRMDQNGPWEHGEGLDHWDRFKINQDRVCSFCGSLHPDDFIRYVEASVKTDSDVQIEPSDKRYKIYVSHPCVRNAHEGGIKFYTWHLAAPLTLGQQETYRLALQSSRDRFEKKIQDAERGAEMSVPVDRSDRTLIGGQPVTEDHREINPVTASREIMWC